MDITMLLCDSALVSEGKLFILGGGWSLTGPDPAPSAIALKMSIPYNDESRFYHWEIFLEDADGKPVILNLSFDDTRITTGNTDGGEVVKIGGRNFGPPGST